MPASVLDGCDWDGEHVSQKRVFGEFDGIAVVENRHRELNHAGVSLHLFVAPHRDIHRDWTVVAARVVECQGLVTDRPFDRGKIADGKQCADGKQNGDTTLHLCTRAIDFRMVPEGLTVITGATMTSRTCLASLNNFE